MLIADTAEARMRSMCQTTNGFEIAEMDLQLRGPGEFFGTRQHGLPEFKLADITSEMDLLRQAKQGALALLEDDPRLTEPVHRDLRLARARQLGDSLALLAQFEWRFCAVHSTSLPSAAGPAPQDDEHLLSYLPGPRSN